MSTYGKIAAPILIAAAIWAKVWVGLVLSVLLVVGVLLLIFKLPRLLPGTQKTDNWARQASFGERIWLNRLLIPIPPDVNHKLTVLYLVFWSGSLIAFLGAVSSSLLLAGSGLIVAYSAQAVCIGKLIGLYRQMRDKAPLYRFWTSTPGNDNTLAKKRA